MVRHDARFTALQRSLLATAAKTRRRRGGRGELFPCRRARIIRPNFARFSLRLRAGLRLGAMHKRIPNMDAISFRALEPADSDEAARLIRTAFAAQPRPTRPAVVGAEGDGRDGRGEDRGRRRGRRLRGRRARRRGALGGKGGALHVARVVRPPRLAGSGSRRPLIEDCEDEAKRRRIERMTLKTRLELAGERTAVRACGFAAATLEAHDGFDKPTTAMMEKRLA